MRKRIQLHGFCIWVSIVNTFNLVYWLSAAYIYYWYCIYIPNIFTLSFRSWILNDVLSVQKNNFLLFFFLVELSKSKITRFGSRNNNKIQSKSKHMGWSICSVVAWSELPLVFCCFCVYLIKLFVLFSIKYGCSVVLFIQNIKEVKFDFIFKFSNPTVGYQQCITKKFFLCSYVIPFCFDSYGWLFVVVAR
jgi:hypothetical protein